MRLAGLRVSGRSFVDLAKLAIVAVVAILLLIIVMNAAINPTTTKTHSYTADITDVSGLRTNGDVRVRGVQVGKITGIRITQHDSGGRAVARVSFTADEKYPVTTNTHLAVKYQNLTGVRYLDLEPAAGGERVSHVNADHTTPSFDITQLFNGLQPVLNTLDTNQINEISQNALAILQGDGRGLAPLMDSLQKISAYASDREHIVSVLVDNMSRISESFGGKADSILQILHSLEVPVDSAIAVLDEFNKTSLLGPQFLGPVVGILRHLGLSPDMNFNDVIKTNFGSPDALAKVLRMIPGMLDLLSSPRIGIASDTTALTCSKGQATLPDDVRMLLNGAEVSICRR